MYESPPSTVFDSGGGVAARGTWCRREWHAAAAGGLEFGAGGLGAGAACIRRARARGLVGFLFFAIASSEGAEEVERSSYDSQRQ